MRSTLRLTSILSLTLVTLASSAFASGLAENFVHPDKVSVAKFASKIQQNFEIQNLEVVTEAPASGDCAIGCSETCVTLARRIVSECSGTGPGGGTTRPDLQACIATMDSYFAGRSGTSGDQDRADAIAYCTSGASQDCAVKLQPFTSKRSGTSGTQDRTDAAYACQNGATPECVSTIYSEYSRRGGTSSNQDVNDSLAACERRR